MLIKEDVYRALTEEGLGESTNVATSRRWPNGVVPYAINSNMPASGGRSIQRAIKHFHENTNVRWVKRTSESSYVEFTFGSINSSYVGRTGGKQRITLNAYWHGGTVLHEMGHCVGFYHEHQRPDRDQYVKIHKENIQKGVNIAVNFGKFSRTSGVAFGPFDTESIMMYLSLIHI